MPSIHPYKPKYDKLIIWSYENCVYGWTKSTENASIMLRRWIGSSAWASSHHRNHYLLLILFWDGLLAKHSDFTLPLFIQSAVPPFSLARSVWRRIIHGGIYYTHFARTIDLRPTARKKRNNTISSTSSSPQQRILNGCKVYQKMREHLREIRLSSWRKFARMCWWWKWDS